MELIFLGTGNAFSESGDRPSSYLITTDSSNILVDCGPSVLPALYQNNVQPSELSAIYISHLHPDHYFGLTFLFLDNYYISRRGLPLPVFCPEGTEKKLLKLVSEMYHDTEVATFRECFNFIEISNNHLIDIPDGKLRTIPAKHGGNGRMAIFEFDEYCIGYSGDTEFYPPSIKIMLDQCDVIIHEATSAELHIPGHTNLFEILDLEIPEFTHLFLSHHDQSVIEALEHVQLPENKHLARDNLRINLQELFVGDNLNLDISDNNPQKE